MEHHPLFSPSSLPMLEHCPCFERADDAVSMRIEPAPRASYRDHGTSMHEAFANRLRDGYTYALKDAVTPHEAEGIQWAVDYALMHKDLNHPFEIEQPLILMDDQFNIVTYGTGDVLNGPRLFDLKTGDYHNYWLQMAAYALMQMDRIEIDEIQVHVLFTRFRKAHQIVISRVAAGERVFKTIKAVQDPKRKPKVNPYCRWCKHLMNCEAVKDLTRIGEEEFKLYGSQPLYFNPGDLSVLLKRARILKEWVAAVENHAKAMAIAGTEIPDFELKSRSGAREIMDVKKAYELCGLPPDIFIALCNLPVGALEDAIAVREEIPKSHARKKVDELLHGVMQRRPPTMQLAAVETNEPTEK